MMGTCIYCDATVVRGDRYGMPDRWVHYHTGDLECMGSRPITEACPSPLGTAWIGYLGNEKEEAWNGGVCRPGQPVARQGWWGRVKRCLGL